MRLTRWLTITGRWAFRAGSSAAVMFVIFLAFQWAHTTHQFDLVDVRLAGNRYLEEDELLGWVRLPVDPVLTGIDLEEVQDHLETHPYIKAARVSRNFPSILQIDVVERVPLAYVNQSPFHLIDDEGVILPAGDQPYEFDIPTLSGFNSAEELYPVGEQCLSRKVLEAVDYLNLIRNRFPTFYDDLSEVRINADDEYVLYLTQYPTEILLGATELSQRLNLLDRFTQTVRGIRSLHDYRYVDLRYKKQIVVRERG